MEIKMNKISIFIGILVSGVTLIGALFLLDARWTKASDTKELRATLCNKDLELSGKDLELLNKIAYQGKRVDQYIAQDRYNWLEERIYILKDRYQNKQMPQSVKEEYRRLESERKIIERKLNK
jgi:hypothetical protein